MTTTEEKITAIHEARHAVACYRLNQQHVNRRVISIVPNECYNGVYSAEETGNSIKESVVLAAGYAAVKLSGNSEQRAIHGCGSDFDEIENFAALSVSEAKTRAIALLNTPENQSAIDRVSEWLSEHRVILGDDFDVLMELSDQEITQAEFDAYMEYTASARKPQIRAYLSSAGA